MQPDTANFAWHVRRSDVVRTLCAAAGRTCTLAYSDPWTSHPAPSQADCAKKSKQDVGTVMMFFFNCPGGTNCGMDWANTHAYGMNQSDPYYYDGYYNPFSNTDFWTGELRDAEYAGLQFILPNVYGTDLNAIAGLAAALAQESSPVKVGLFNDTWAYGNTLPAVSLSNAAQAAQTIYSTQWHPFFTTIPSKYWYIVNGRPLIYFYNAGTLTPLTNAAAVVSDLKKLFQTSFGVAPFVVVDKAYFADPNMSGVADGEFVWDVFVNNPASGVNSVAMNNLTFANGFVKWDSFNRDGGPIAATAANDTKMVKGPGVLHEILQNAAGADVLLLQTWNDLGEGTGFNRNYDYYYQGQWLSPDYFLKIVRQSNCTN